MEHKDASAWVERYLTAWSSDDPDDVAALFTEDARYLTGPFDEPWTGRDAIVAKWIEAGDSDVEWSFTWDVIAIDGDLAVIEGETTYLGPPEKAYRNMWLVRFAGDGRAREFTEWWKKRPDSVA